MSIRFQSSLNNHSSDDTIDVIIDERLSVRTNAQVTAWMELSDVLKGSRTPKVIKDYVFATEPRVVS